MEDLWPDDIPRIELRSPVAILREQASLLGRKTQNLVEAEVKPLDTKSSPSTGRYDFGYAFLVTAPALGNYRYTLFRIYHGIQLYPLDVDPDADIAKEIPCHLGAGGRSTFTVESEDDLLEALKKIFNARKTRQLINVLLAQVSETK